jgi:hypothetical protein
MIVNFRSDFDRNCIKILLLQGVRTIQIKGKYFNYKEYKKITEDINTIYSEKNEIPSIIFHLKGHETLVTNVQNIFNKNNFSTGQIIKIIYDDLKNQHILEKENYILLDKKISNFLSQGDILEFSDSTLVLKILSIEKNKKNKIQKYKNLLKTVNENEYKDIEEQLKNKNKKRKYSDTEFDEKNIGLTKSYSQKINQKIIFNDIDIDIDKDKDKNQVLNEYPKIKLEEKIEIEDKDIDSHNHYDNDKYFSLKKYNTNININTYMNIDINQDMDINIDNNNNNLYNKKYKRIEDDIREYENIYNYELEDIFKEYNEKEEDHLVNNYFRDNDILRINKLDIISEDSDEFCIENLVNKFHFNDDEEFPLDGKYFDNLYNEQEKAREEKMDLIYNNIIKRQISDNLNYNNDSSNNNYSNCISNNYNHNININENGFNFSEQKRKVETKGK